jgi:hypothetical protein
MLLMKRLNVAETDLNVRPEQKVCVAVACLACLALLLAAWLPWLLGIAAACPVVVVALNRSFYAFLARKRGLAFAAGSIPIHLVYYACCGMSVVLALGIWHLAPVGSQTRGAVPAPKLIGKGQHAAASLGRGSRLFRLRRPTRWTRR